MVFYLTFQLLASVVLYFSTFKIAILQVLENDHSAPATGICIVIKITRTLKTSGKLLDKSIIRL